MGCQVPMNNCRVNLYKMFHAFYGFMQSIECVTNVGTKVLKSN